MIMCCPDRTHFKPIQHAARTLAESGATVIGIVVNDVEMGGSGSAFTPTGHSYGYNYGYGGYRAYGAYRPYGPLKSKDEESKDGGKAAAGKSPKADDDTEQEPRKNSRAQPIRSEIADEA